MAKKDADQVKKLKREISRLNGIIRDKDKEIQKQKSFTKTANKDFKRTQKAYDELVSDKSLKELMGNDKIHCPDCREIVIETSLGNKVGYFCSCGYTKVLNSEQC